VIEIFGCKGNIQNIEKILKQVENLSNKYNIILQVFNADFIYGKNHLLSAVNHAKRAFAQNTNSLNSLALELLLYMSGERQIQKAILKIGINKTTNNFAFVLISKDKNEFSEKILIDVISSLNLIRDDKVLEGNIDNLKRFGISEYELETISKDKYKDLILEKVALVDIIK